jgi:chromatin structure-remodeling complex subunit SFH1
MAAYRKIWGDWQHQAAQQRMASANSRGSTPRPQTSSAQQQHVTPSAGQLRPAGQIRPPRPASVPTPQAAPPPHPIFGHRAPPPPRPLNPKRSDPPHFAADLNARHHYQAAFTTYPSRLRLGLTSLMQPIGPGGQTTSAVSTQPSQTSVFQSGSVLGKRQRQVVNYAEMENFDDLEDNATSGDDEQPRSARIAAMNARKAAQAQASGQSTPGTATPLGGGKTYLGQLPPSNMIMVEPAKKTRHIYP